MKKKLTQKQINSKYKGKYVELNKTFNYSTRNWEYEVLNSYETIHENTTLGEDVGTSYEYKR